MLERLGDAASNAVAAARDEAYRLGHRQIGTEHLLLGLIGQTGTAASDALIAAGASLVSARDKVVEALSRRATGPAARAGDDLPFTDRASRALDRANRLSLRTGSEFVLCEHILISLLDVEGTAGQVLRGLGVDPEAVRRAVLPAPPTSSPTEEAPSQRSEDGPPPVCATCGSVLAESLARRILPVRDGDGSVRVAVFYCAVCGTTAGVDRA